VAGFWTLDVCYFGSCMLKFLSGGWFPVMVAMNIMLLMITWRDGWRALGERIFRLKLRIDQFMERIWVTKPLRLPGAGVYLSTFRTEVPPMLQYHINQTHSLHERVIILSVYTTDVPVVPEAEKVEVRNLGQGCYRVLGHFGFMEMPDIPQLLELAKAKDLDIDPEQVSYFLGRISLVPAREKRVLDPVRRFLFAFMQRNAVSPVVYYNIPPDKVLELGVQMDF
jgi:KUP system potassium uptake protein